MMKKSILGTRYHLLCFAFLVIFSLVHTVQATPLTYDELSDGDLGTLFSPTPLTLDFGNNLITGAVGPIETDRYDAFTLGLPSGSTLTGIFLIDYINPGAFGDFESTFTGLTNLGDFLPDADDIDTSDIGTNLLPILESQLGAGEFFDSFFWDEQNSRASYTLRLEVDTIAAVPEPSIIALFAAGLFGLGFARRRKA